MKNLTLVGIAFLIASSQIASAQAIVNGSFSNGFTGWAITVGVSGGPVVITTNPVSPIVNNPPATPNGSNTQALINSTGGLAAPPGFSTGYSVSAATLNTFLNTTLPPNATGIAIDGQAIKQTFTSLGSSKLTFSYDYNSRELPNNGFDETGYVLNGTFHILADTNTPGLIFPSNIGFFVVGSPYQTKTIIVGPGVDTIGFVAYNTFNTASPSGLFLTNINLLPIFGSFPGLTPNELSVANYIDANDGTATGNFAALVAALSAATSVSVVASELDQLSPQSLQIFRSIAFNNATFTTQDVNNHLANLRDGLTGFDGSQLTVYDPGMDPGASNIKSRLRDPKAMRDPKEMSDPKEMTPTLSAVPVDRWSTFISGTVILADLGHDQDVAHQDYTTGSVMVGADYRIDDHFTVGSFLSYSHTDANLDHNGSSATVDTYSPGVYASYVDGGWYGNGLFAYGFNSYTEDRNIAIGALNGTDHGAPTGNQYEGNLTGGYEFRDGSFKYGPFASLQYVNFGINSFDESGPIPLDVQNQTDESLRSQLGF